jgi:post-segregation antitoxin (ccd killing protein)
MGRYITVSTKVRKELKEEADKLGLRISEFLRRALEEEVKRKKLERLKEDLNGVDGALNRIDINDIVKGIREDRELR